MSQKNQKRISLMTSLTKNLKPKTPKKIFHCQTRSFAKSFEGLNSSLVQSTGELWSCKVAQKLRLMWNF